MSRLLIQSAETFMFLHFSPVRHEVCWTPSLQAALLHGVVKELDEAAQLVRDHADRTAIVVDLDQA